MNQAIDEAMLLKCTNDGSETHKATHELFKIDPTPRVQDQLDKGPTPIVVV